MNNSKLILSNTIVLYIKLIIGIVIGLITTRIIVKALGEVDFGVYIIVSGVVMLLNVFNSNLINSSMRFLAVGLGENNSDKTKRLFSTILLLHFILGILVFISMQILGLWIFDGNLNVPANRLDAAKIVFNFMVFSMFFTVISVPYDSLMTAYENISILSVFDIFSSLLRLLTAFIILNLEDKKLETYGMLVFVIDFLIRILKQFYCRKKYSECKGPILKNLDISILREIINYTIWNFLGSLGALAVTQIKNLLLNKFFGVKINAAEGISSSVNGQVNMFSVNLTNAILPQLMKSEGSGNRKKMINLTIKSTKLSVLMFAIVAIPILMNLSFLLTQWLGNLPKYTTILVQLSLIILLIEKFSFQLTNAIKAVGDIRKFQVVETLFLLSSIPISYTCFRNGYEPFSIYVITIIIAVALFLVRIYFARKIVGIGILEFLKKAVLPVLLSLFFSVSSIIPLTYLFTSGWSRLIVTSFIFMIVLLTFFWFLCFNNLERHSIKGILKSYFNKYGN